MSAYVTSSGIEFGAHRVLVLDDNRSFQHLFRTILRGFGLRRVDVMSDPGRLLPVLQQHHFDILFMDLVFPSTHGKRMVGFDVIDAIRHTAVLANPRMPVVLVTGHASRAVLRQAVLSGADHVLAKPVSPNSLLRVSRVMLDKPPEYVWGDGGYFGPDVPRSARPRPVARREEQIRNADRAGGRADRSSNLPGMHVPLRGDASAQAPRDRSATGP